MFKMEKRYCHAQKVDMKTEYVTILKNPEKENQDWQKMEQQGSTTPRR